MQTVTKGYRKTSRYTKANLYSVFGYSRQAYHQGLRRVKVDFAKEKDMLQAARDIKAIYPGIGTEKLRIVSQALFPHVRVYGRDKYHALMKKHGLINRRRKGRSTTNSNHRFRKYGFLAEGLKPTAPNQLWVSDITYISLKGEERCYLHLTTDVYSRKIVGWSVSPTLHAEYTLEALKMAVNDSPDDTDFTHLIHHSDRGIQYCCDGYTAYLHGLGIQISMTQDGNPLDNAIAERVNGILKSEAIERIPPFTNLEEAREKIGGFINFYNRCRPHRSIGMSTPDKVYNGEEKPDQNNRKKKKLYLCGEGSVNALRPHM